MAEAQRNDGGRLAGRRALVTGGSSGIGRATVKRLAEEGAAVVVNYVGGAEGAREVVEEVGSEGGRATAIAADVSDEGAVTEMFRRAEDELGTIDLLVNNAGVEKPFPLVDMPLEEWNRILAVNLTGSFLCARETARRLIERRSHGAIVNVTSVHEMVPWDSFSHYCASKGGLKLFAQSIAKELAPHGIRVVSVAPGAIATPINRDVLEDPEKRRAVEDEIPWGRMGTPEEVAGAIAWLAGPEATYVTGATLFVDGGMTLYPGFT